VVLNASSLRTVKTLPTHAGDITMLRYCEEDGVIVTRRLGWRLAGMCMRVCLQRVWRTRRLPGSWTAPRRYLMSAIKVTSAAQAAGVPPSQRQGWSRNRTLVPACAHAAA